MDWAASEWKQNLPPAAIQKINCLEEQVARFQKERQQKQFQIESLEQNLDIQKRKVEDEKTQRSHLLREQQSLAETCTNLEQKVQKLMQDVQTKDNKVNCLEGQLVQAKKQVDAGSLKVNELEKTVAGLQHHSQSQPDTNLFISSEGIGSSQVSHLEMLLKEKEELIKELMLKMKEMEHHAVKESGESIQSKGDVRSQYNQFGRDTPQTSLWDTIGTPLKRGMNRHHDALEKSKLDNDLASQKVYSLEQKLKQITQELECQRHNSEAAKQALEQKFKEKETGYKQEIKQQAQALSDLDRKYNDTKTKLQQELTQALKTVDATAFQLDKTQHQKQEQEKELAKLHNTVRELESQCLSTEKLADDLKSSVQNLDEVKCSLTSRLEQQERKSNDLQQQLTKTENKLGQQEAEIERLKFELDDKKQQVQELQGKMTLLTQQHNSAIQEFKVKSTAMEKENQQLTRNIADKNNIIEDKENKICNYHQQCDGLQNKISSLQQSLDTKEKYILRLEKDIKASNASNAEKDIKLSTLTEELSKTKILLQQQNEKCIQYNNELTQNKKEIDSKNKQITHLDTNLANKTEKIALLEGQLKDYQDTLNKKEKLLASQESDLKTFKQSIKDSETKLKQMEANLKERSDQNYQLKLELNDKVAEMKGKISSLERDLSDKKEQIAIKEKQAETLSANLKEQDNHLKSNKEKLLHVENQLKEKENKLASALKTNTENEIKHKSSEKALQEKIQQLEELQKTDFLRITEKEAEVKELESKLRTKNDEISSFDLQLKTVTEEKMEIETIREKLENEMKVKEQKLLEYKDNTQQLINAKEQVEILNGKINTETENLKKLQSNINALEEDLVQTKINLEETTKDNEDKIEKIRTLESVIAEKETKFACMESEVSTLLNSIKEQKLIIEQFEVTISEKEALVEKTKQQFDDLSHREGINLNKLKELEQILKIKDEKIEQELLKYKDNEQQLIEAREQIDSLNKTLVIKDNCAEKCQSEIVTLEETLKQNRADLEELTENNKCKIKEIKSLEMIINEKQEEITRIENELAITSENFVLRNSSIEQFESIIAKKDTQLKEYEQRLCDTSQLLKLHSNKIEELEYSLKEKDKDSEQESHNKNTEHELINATQQIDVLNEKLAAQGAIIETYLSDIGKLQEDLTEARKNLSESVTEIEFRSDTIKHLECMIDEKEKQVVQVQNEFVTISNELEMQKSLVKEYEKVIMVQKLELEQCEKQLNDLTVLQESSSKKVIDLETLLNVKDEEIEKECKKYRDVKQQLIDTQMQINILNTKLSSDEESLENFQTEITILQETLAKIKISFEEISKDNELKLEKIKYLENVIDEKKNKIDHMEKEYAATSNNLEEQKIAIKLSENIVAEKEAQLVKYKQQLQDVSKYEVPTLNKLDSLEFDIKGKDEHIAHLENQIKLYNEETKMHKENIDSYIKEITELKKRNPISSVKISPLTDLSEQPAVECIEVSRLENDNHHSEQVKCCLIRILKIVTGRIQTLLQTCYGTEICDGNNLTLDASINEVVNELLEKSKGNYLDEGISREISLLIASIELEEKELFQLQDALSGATWLLTLKECLLTESKENIEKLEKSVMQHKVKCKELNKFLQDERIKIKYLEKQNSVVPEVTKKDIVDKDLQIKQLEEQLHAANWSIEIKDGRLSNLKEEVITLENALQKYENKNNVLQRELQNFTQEKEKLNQQSVNVACHLEESHYFNMVNNEKLKQLEQNLNNAKWLATIKECVICEQKDEISKLKRAYEEQSGKLHSAVEEKTEISKKLENYLRQTDHKPINSPKLYHHQCADEYSKTKRIKLSDSNESLQKLEKENKKASNKKLAHQSKVSPVSLTGCHFDKASEFVFVTERLHQQNATLKQLELELNNVKWLLMIKECVIHEQRDDLKSLKRTCEEQTEQLQSAIKDKQEISKALDECAKYKCQVMGPVLQNLSCDEGCFLGNNKLKRINLHEESFLNTDTEDALSSANWSLVMNECMLSDLKHEISILHTTLEEERHKNNSLLLKLSEKDKSTEQYTIRNDICVKHNKNLEKVPVFPVETIGNVQESENAVNSAERENCQQQYQHNEFQTIEQQMLSNSVNLSEILTLMAADKLKWEKERKCIESSFGERTEISNEIVKSDYYLYRKAFEIIKETHELLKKIIIKAQTEQDVWNTFHSARIEEYAQTNLESEVENAVLPTTKDQLVVSKQTPKKETKGRTLVEEEVQLNLIAIESLKSDILKKKTELVNLEKGMNVPEMEKCKYDVEENITNLTLEEAVLNQNTIVMLREIKISKVAEFNQLCEKITAIRRFHEVTKEKNNELERLNEVVRQNIETVDLLNKRSKLLEELLEKANKQLNSEAAANISQINNLMEQNAELQELCATLRKQVQCSTCKISELEQAVEKFSKKNQMNEQIAKRCQLLENVKKEHNEIYGLLETICNIETKASQCSKNEFSSSDNNITATCNVQFEENVNDGMITVEMAKNFKEKLKRLEIWIQEIVEKYNRQSGEIELIRFLETEKVLLSENLSELHNELAAATNERDHLVIQLQAFKEGTKRFQIIINELRTMLEVNERTCLHKSKIALEQNEIPVEIHCQITNALDLISQLRDEKQIVTSKVEQQQNTITHLENTIEEVRSQEQMLISKIERQQSAIRHLNEIVEEVKHEKTAFNSKVEQMSSTTMELNEIIKESQTRELALISQVEQQQNTIEELNKTVNEVEDKNVVLSSHVEGQQNTITQLNETIEEIEENLQKLFEEKTKCLEKIKHLEGERDQFSLQCCNLQKKVEQLNNFHEQNEKLKKLNSELQKENERLKIISEQLQAQLTMLQDETEKHLENEETVLELETKLIELQIKMEETENELTSINKKYAMECNNVKELKQTITFLTSDEVESSKELQGLRSRCNELEMTNSCLSQDLTEHTITLQKEQSRREDVEKSLIRLKEESQEKEKGLLHQLDEYSKKVNCLSNRLRALDANLTTAYQERDSLLKEHEENERELEKSWKRVKDAEEALLAKDKELKTCQNKLDIAMVEYGWNKQTWQDTSSSLQKQLASAESKAEKLKNDLDATKSMLTEQEGEIQSKQQDLKQCQLNLQDSLDKLNIKNKELNKANHKIEEIEESFSFCQLKLEAQIKTTEKEQSLIIQLKNRIKCANEKLEKEKCKLQEQVSKKRIAEEALKTTKSENDKILSSITTLQTICEEKDNQIKLLQEKKTKELENKNESQLQLEPKIKEMEKKHENLTDQLCQKTADNKALDGMCKSLQATCQQLEEEISELKKKLHSEASIVEQISAHNKSLEELSKSLQVSHEQLVKELSDKNKQNADETYVLQNLKEQLAEKNKLLEQNESELAEIWVKYAESIQEGNTLRDKCKYLKVKLQSYKEELQHKQQERHAQQKSKESRCEVESKAVADVTAKSQSNLLSSLHQKTSHISDASKGTDITSSTMQAPTLGGVSTINELCPPPLKVKPRGCSVVNLKRGQAQPSGKKRICKENKTSKQDALNTQTTSRSVLSIVSENKSSKDEERLDNELQHENGSQQRFRKGENSVPKSGTKVASKHISQNSGTPIDKSNNSSSMSPTPLSLHNVRSKTLSSPLSYASQKKVLPSPDDCKMQ